MTSGHPLPVRPPLRWAGSKRRSLTTLRALCPRQITHYFEPFAGSACLTFSLAAEKVTIADLNPYLIEFYQYLKADPEALYSRFSQILRDEDEYYRVRQEFNNSPASIERASYFLYLNRYCFNGIYRVNKSGKFNVPWGGRHVGEALQLRHLKEASAHLANTEIRCADFQDIALSARPGAFIYLDPPYAANEKRVFREYVANSFSSSDWGRFVETLEELDRRNIQFLLTYDGDPSLLKSLSRWNSGFHDVTRNVGGFRATRRTHREFIARNFDEGSGSEHGN